MEPKLVDARIKDKLSLCLFLTRNYYLLKVEGSEKWTVRRLRRRTRTSSLRKQEETTAKENQDKDEKDIDSSLPLPPPPPIPRDDSNSSILEACGMQEKKPINAETLVFGGTLSKHHVANIEVIIICTLRMRSEIFDRRIFYL